MKKKADVIRAVIGADPDGKPKDLAVIASKRFGGEVKPVEISNYKTQLKKQGMLNGKPQEAPPTLQDNAPLAPKPVKRMSLMEVATVLNEIQHHLGKEMLTALVKLL